MDEKDAIAKVKDLGQELSRRARRVERIEQYVEGPCPLPQSIERARVTKAYRMLMGLAETPYARKVVKAASTRLEIGGIRSGDKAIDQALWALWQANRMDAESKRAHDQVLTHGRVFGIVWPRGESVEMTLENPDTVIVEYLEGSRYDRSSALRRWVTDGTPYATLYTPDEVWKFVGKKGSASDNSGWTRRIVDGEEWPLPAPRQGIVPVVEIATGRSLKPGRFGDARGDLDGVEGLLDRINVLEFLRLVIAFTAGFPVRVVIGDEILKDDDGKQIAPFELAADIIAQLENPDAKVQELDAADLKGFGEAIGHDVQTLAAITSTPSQELQALPMQNVSADAIRASDSARNDRVADHKPQLSEGWEELVRTAGMMLPVPVQLPQTAEVRWVNREYRSIAERADAATKLGAAGWPWQAVLELVFDLTQEEITRFETMRGSDALTSALSQPTPTIPPA